MNQKVLISVLNFNNFHSTKKCVLSILSCSLKNIEILVVDNDSKDKSYQKLKVFFKDLKVVKSKYNKGYAAGHKIAVNYAFENNFELIWILNNDLIVRNDTLQGTIGI